MEYEKELERYEKDGEGHFDNYAGQGLPDEDDFYYEDEEYEDEYEDEFDSYSGDAVGTLDPNDTTYTFVVTNTNDEDKDVVLFGANENLAPPENVTVEVAESSHNEVREESKANPFTIVGMKMSVSNSQQFDNVLFLYEKTSTGRTTTNVRQPRTWQSPQNFDQKSIHAINFTMHVTGKTSLRFKAKKGTTVFTFSVQSRTNLGNVLIGKNVAEVNTAPQVTGLPQMDDRLKPISKLRRMVQPVHKVRKRRFKRPAAQRPVRQTFRREG
jgi:hypothetical protein